MLALFITPTLILWRGCANRANGAVNAQATSLHDAATTACDQLKLLKAVQEHIEAKVGNSQQPCQRNQQTIQKLQLATASAEVKIAQAARPHLVLAAKRHDGLQSHLNSLGTAATAAMKRLSAAQAAASLAARAAELKTTTAYAAPPSSNTAVKKEISLDALKTEKIECPKDTTDIGAKIPQWLAAGNINKMAYFQLESDTSTHTTAGRAAICSPGSGTTGCTTNTAQYGLSIEAGTVLKVTKKVLNEEAASKQFKETTYNDAEHETDEEQAAALGNTLKCIADKLEPPAQPYQIPTLKASKASAEFRAALLLCTSPQPQSYADTKHKQKTEELFDQIYGSDEEQFKTSFVKQLDEAPIPKEVLGSGSEATAKDITSAEKLALATAYYTAIRAAQQMVKTSTALPATVSNDCAKKSQKRHCNESDGCKWEGTEEKGTCKYKVEENAVAKDRKKRKTRNAKIRKRMTANLRIVSGKEQNAKTPVFIVNKNFL
uniref:Variant surface glycoprotein 1060 n=1 Tax=Trypanosoma brucei TaxID=5691 RepID=M4SXI4_9TRYP|nr:variant surface glycoprotein 1060 [Trypanosoma brucei]